MRKKEILEILTKIILNKNLIKLQILAKPQTSNFSLIGTAFDYILRFYLEKNSNILEKNSNYENITTYFLFDNKQKKYIENTIVELKLELSEYLKTNIFSDKFIKLVLEISHYEAIYRTGGKYEAKRIKILSEDILDLKKLIEIIPENYFKNTNTILNPQFKYSSTIIGGGDADLIINNKLIDIKTTKELSFTKSYLYQLIGYYILYLLEKEKNPIYSNILIDKVGIYYSRYAYLYLLDINEILTKEDVELLKKYFLEYGLGLR